MFNNPVKPKTIGYFALIPAFLMLLGSIFAIIFIPSFGFAAGVSFMQLVPFFLLMFFFCCFAGFGGYVAWRNFRNNPFKENKTAGVLLVNFSIVYFVYSALSCLISNLTGNIGGYVGPVAAFLSMLILVPVGLGLKNGYKYP